MDATGPATKLLFDADINTSPVLTAEEMKAFGAKIEELAAFCASQGIDLVYHHHMGTVVETPAEIDAFMDATGPATKLLFDAGHCYFGSNGQDPAPVLEKHAARVKHFHAKNVRPAVMKDIREDKKSFMDASVPASSPCRATRKAALISNLFSRS